ncbi:dual specificity protein phosphatase, putative [Entamoeba dispar SAW760]|uniref:protein-tyrosine-phosphatase n=1 Tax=Entamoeba dispar (strain ATCC PRA-260 / SAW760) TaxID=370354 RepID=B0EBI1_ENTDS|nr:dual specificity protein phosphatase, putative [Entamoeba dispar SAW760]EDR28088.1 dual specificity protein phosphatase, putative [Entamoeba dispar SAW760]|eukprot:EDR28088.1 dual specificity protein phosphatase, putative [Entamoeba dispar SAW760]
MQRPITQFIVIKPKKDGDKSVGQEIKEKQEREFKLFKQKERERMRIELQKEKNKMEVEEKKIDSYQRLIEFKKIKEQKQRAFGIGCSITKDIYIGSVESSNNQAWLDSECINVIINCTCECSNEEEEGREYYRLPISKYHNTINPFVKEACALINLAHSKGEKVLIHSFDGKNRAPALLIAYLIQNNKMSFMNAFNMVKTKAWTLELSMVLVSELNALSSQLGLTSISGMTASQFKQDPLTRRALEDAELEIADRKKKWEFSHNVID